MTVIVVKNDFSVCKLPDFTEVDPQCDFCFLAKTDDECSLVCPSAAVPHNAVAIDNGWKMFRIGGVLDFSLVGILAKITTILAGEHIPVFAVSTFDTDYVLTKREHFAQALKTLENNGFKIVNRPKA